MQIKTGDEENYQEVTQLEALTLSIKYNRIEAQLTVTYLTVIALEVIVLVH